VSRHLATSARKVAALAQCLQKSGGSKRWLKAHPELWEALDELRLADSALYRSFLGAEGTSAQGRLLVRLKLSLGQDVSSRELARAAGIDAWQRRIRELRVEQGWRIEPRRGGDAYVLLSTRRQATSARDWRFLNRLRRSKRSARDKVLELLIYRLKKPVTRKELLYVVREREATRRIRDLDERGWQIRSERQAAELFGGAYMLTSLRQVRRVSRVPLARREAYLLKHPTCELCGATKGKDRWLEVDHKKPISQHRPGGLNPNRPSNLQTRCNVCHAGKTANERMRTR